MGELELIKKFRAGAPGHLAIVVGPGSDCAVLNWPADSDLLYKIDQIVEGTHFTFDGHFHSTARQVGWKAMAKACSDIAAAGGWPVAAAVAINLKKGSPESLAEELYAGMIDCCKRFEFGLAGGDFSTSENALSVVVSLLGTCPKGKAWTRGGARPGDSILVTGSLGASRKGKHHDFIPRLEEVRRIRALCLDGVHACIDITDGLSRDLYHICEESHCGASISETQVPLSANALGLFVEAERAFLHALTDGEDFELLLAVDEPLGRELLEKWDMPTPLTCIGEIVSPQAGISFVSQSGEMRPLPNIGYEHRV